VAHTESTRWTIIRAAAKGSRADREEFARRYAPVIRAYLGARWRAGPLNGEIDDATQEVFLACFKEGGALERFNPEAPGRFRSFLYGVVLNIARRFEEKRGRRREEQPPSDFDIEAREARISEVFDRAWASALLQRAARLQAQHAETPEAQRRVELMQLHFGEDLPIREIAERWQVDAAQVHHAYARAREGSGRHSARSSGRRRATGSRPWTPSASG
jgi:RNA polymerase sigma-70 factor (ECF subfamily)